MFTLPVALNAACTTAAAALLVPLIATYPAVAHAMVAHRTPGTLGYVALDAALCLGPLLVPMLLLLGASALQAAWAGEAVASRLNAASLCGWGAAGTALATVAFAS